MLTLSTRLLCRYSIRLNCLALIIVYIFFINGRIGRKECAFLPPFEELTRSYSDHAKLDIHGRAASPPWAMDEKDKLSHNMLKPYVSIGCYVLIVHSNRCYAIHP